MKERRRDFFIGWQEGMPSSNKVFLKRVIIAFLILLAVIIISLVLLQKPYNNHIFQLGTLSNISGTYYEQPVPVLLADEEELPEGFAKEIMLVGFGKFGAEGIMNEIEKTQGTLNGKNITLSGTLISGDGKTLMELTRKTNAFVSLNESSEVASSSRSSLNDIVITGEILDPKCYFGVMKPGEGKVHKSCATRCISGGIPPVLRHETGDPDIPYSYFIVLGKNGNKINAEILPFVAERVEISGECYVMNGWNIIYTEIGEMNLLE